MKLHIFFLGVFVSLQAQPNALWKSYFSYAEIRDVSQSSNHVVAATDNALFVKNVSSGDLKTITSINGFKPEDISCLHYSETTGITAVGNTNGLFQLIKPDNTIVNKYDIISEVQVAASKKKINHIYEYGNKLYLSCDFGIIIFNTDTLEFGDTIFISSTGQEVKVSQTTVRNGLLYAATHDGLKSCPVNNPFMNDFNQWTTIIGGYWFSVATINSMLVGISTSYELIRLDVYQTIGYIGQVPTDFRVVDNKLFITIPNACFIFNSQLQQQSHITSIPSVSTSFTCATMVQEQLFLGTSDKGLFQTQGNFSVFENVSPNGPLRNYIFRVTAGNNLYAVHGQYSRLYNPHDPVLGAYGVSQFIENTWNNIPYQSVDPAKALSSVTIDPKNNNILYIPSFHSGLLKITNNSELFLYNDTNTGTNGLESLVYPPDPNYKSIRTNGSVFDSNHNLWVTVSKIEKAIKVLKNDGNWQSYSLEDITVNPTEDSYGPLVIDKYNTKWIPSLNNGVIAFNETLSNKFILLKSEQSNLPDNDVRSLAIDKKGQLWIGTYQGLRILSNVSQFLTETQLTTKNIVIEEEGMYQELFYKQTILSIAVDGANTKWVSLAGAGVFHVSADGQQTLHQFNKDNSPLPSNNINSIAIDETNGEVFFGTDKGLISFQGTATQASSNLDNVLVYPNPVRPNYQGDITLSGLINKANVKITDIEGNLVYETTTEGGSITWDTTAFGKYKVASGVYLIFIASEDGLETKVKKVMIIR